MSDIFALTQRTMLKEHRAWALKNKIPLSDVRPSVLKLYAKLTTTSDMLVFHTSDQFPTGVATEKLLPRESLFFANLFALGVHKIQVVSGVKFPHNTQPYFYADKTTFSDALIAPSVFTEAGCVQAIWNGLLSFKTSQTVRLDQYPCNVFQEGPQTQVAATTQSSSPGVNWVDLNVSFGMSGQTDNIFNLSLGSGSDRSSITGGAESENWAVLFISGFEVVNGARADIKADN